MDSKVVITVAHNMERFKDSPGELRVRLGDWNPNYKTTDDFEQGQLEEYPELEVCQGFI